MHCRAWQKWLFLPFSLELIVHWAQDFYEFRENELATVELVVETQFDVDFSIRGFPVQIGATHPNSFPPLLVPAVFQGKGDSIAKWAVIV